MADAITRILLPDHQGWGEWGYHAREEMVAIYKANAKRNLQEAQRILAADPNEFVVQTWRGNKLIVTL